MKQRQPQRQKHTPQRTCIVCRTTGDKRKLTRLVRTSEAGVVVDPTGKRSGRGAYLCDQPDCWQKALNSRILDQALKTQVTVAEKEVIAAYQSQLAR